MVGKHESYNVFLFMISVVDPNSFFSDSDPQHFFFLDSDTEPVRYVIEKILSIKKQKIFLFQVFDLRFFTQIFILQQCLDPNSYPNPNFFSDSDPAKTFGFFRIRIHNTVYDVKMYWYLLYAGE
jgi:hypothetical protein